MLTQEGSPKRGRRSREGIFGTTSHPQLDPVEERDEVLYAFDRNPRSSKQLILPESQPRLMPDFSY
ncbi:hypothetical protein NG895_09925 [Aeoliella sp. ICT_H6.2]|uniref:Uncharacterized protein n=1 Tax=Aeoliella straminimaris TaxID=2954799 RepID=A0A9X2FDB8_9BACT|nr:hypothetical protein [Aeoliella straminimaris]